MQQHAGRPRISDVASGAGVSKSTVSIAFNNPERLSPETIARIHAVADALGYRPHPVARMLAQRRTSTLGILTPQALWFSRVRVNPFLLFIIALIINIGMWLERFVIIVISLTRDFVPSSFGMYYPTRWDWMTYFGTIGMFLTAIFLFVRILPMISIFEMRTFLPEAEVKGE